MSNSETDNNESKVRLTILTGDAASEVFVVNSRLDLAAQGVGSPFETALESGIYKIKVRSGSQIREKLITLPEGAGSVSFEFEPLRFASPAPLETTDQTHEYQMYGAEEFSQPDKMMLKIGKGCSFFFFARFWTVSDDESARLKLNTETSPAHGLSLHDENGTRLADIDALSVKDFSKRDSWAAFHIGVAPGNYRLRLETGDGMQLEQTLIAASGWQTQVFLMPHDYGKNEVSDFRADLSGAAIIMSDLNTGFRVADSKNLRTDELARLALIQGREIITADFRNQLLGGKYRNPLFGIYGAHLLLSDKNPDINLLKIVVRNLRRLLGTDHPDVEALALRTGEQNNPGFVFHAPPMLRRSWAIIVEKTAERAEIVPARSLAQKVSTRIWGNDSFLIWIERYSSNVLGRNRKTSSNPYRTALKQHIKLLSSQKYADRVSADRKTFSGRFESAGTESNHSLFPNLEEIPGSKLEEQKRMIPELVKSLGLPQTTIEEMLGSKGI